MCEVIWKSSNIFVKSVVMGLIDRLVLKIISWNVMEHHQRNQYVGYYFFYSITIDLMIIKFLKYMILLTQILSLRDSNLITWKRFFFNPYQRWVKWRILLCKECNIDLIFYWIAMSLITLQVYFEPLNVFEIVFYLLFFY